MATFYDVKIMERRPCVVILNGEEVKAMFHTWYDGKAIIELGNGSVHIYDIENGSLVFLDSNFEDYDWHHEGTCASCAYIGTHSSCFPCSQCNQNQNAISNGINMWVPDTNVCSRK